jgi:hypothetical protein
MLLLLLLLLEGKKLDKDLIALLVSKFLYLDNHKNVSQECIHCSVWRLWKVLVWHLFSFYGSRESCNVDG